MTFTQLEIFVMVADMRGFTSAALRLGISQSAVSHAIRSLEQELDVQLVERQQAAVEVTELGRRLLLRAREILGLQEAMRQDAAVARGLNQGLIRIGSFGPTSSLKLLPAILKAFRARYPGIEVQIDEGPDAAVIQWVADRRVDIGFAVLPDDRFDTIPLVEDQLVALLQRDHPLAAKRSVMLEELIGVPFIMPEQGCSALVEPLFAGAGLAPHVRYRMSQMVTVLGLVDNGDGITVMPELALPQAMAETHPRIVARPLRPMVRRRVGLILRNLSRAAPAVQAFAEIARTAAKAMR
ncbi:LysR family transcriptional regulator [Pseudoduganella umbonata]|uniref:DNA-binding transcriptional LysR family regulator n=1 Tax=Pseudoduganella umbonata TaxID=864828 RepID=A0A4P8HRQ4_9BURK|nr:LysR family transcriptional regulator [Pseudoduganella umbonata]MBB3222322.1 DNA-binding transcriptional LysR family regulator [Pseudoduganella umbonata]QCP12539.1 LysR family transcriptional regulator [Pseudoduganella umbonata]